MGTTLTCRTQEVMLNLAMENQMEKIMQTELKTNVI